ncbi:stage II sporulation protein M [Sporanaerobacter acetigenes]|uniref:Stage II sporulation protein M n=1 Tax=Sporanaerobacter acetigenes DSM 13106 TaxID=1123281 RepID=A0A1M5XNJ0_9FIRM|nr:stage II sporulation protein M [Sporanaerobacter acetigenes]SHI01309.1 stage II sporulation protein M [Sporanaerobacter acetigenes DSM 13106]
MQHKLRVWISKHLEGNFVAYFTMLVFLIIGIVVGAITIKMLNIDQKNKILSFFNSFFVLMNGNEIDNLMLFKESIKNNFRTVLIIWLTGAIIIGIPIIPVIVVLRGFALGFTVGFLVNEFGAKGFLFSVLAIMPQNLFIIPGIISISSIGINFSLSNVKGNKIKSNYNNLFSNFINYSTLIFLFSLVIFIGSLVEAYVTPIFMRLITDYIN